MTLAQPAHAPVALVVGGSRGLGLLIAARLRSRGHTVVVAARGADALEAAVALLKQRGSGPAPLARRCDIRDEAQVRDLVAWVEAEVGPIEVVVVVAGVIQAGPAEAMTEQHYDEAIDTMLLGPIRVARAVVPRMRARGRGRIGTVTSIGGMISPPHLLPYATAKFGAVGFSDGLAASLMGTGVTATTIVPGLMRTGGHEHAQFTGDAAAEYAWFAPAASLPLLSMNADRAAVRIVDAVLAGKPMVVLTPLAWLGIRVRGLAPATTTRLMGVANRLLPKAPPDAQRSPTVDGVHADQLLQSPTVRRLVTLGRRAAERNNERR